MQSGWKHLFWTFLLVQAMAAIPAAGLLNLGPEQLVQSDDVNIDVPGYSVPCYVDVTADGLADLIVGQGDYASAGMVRIYTNTGSVGAPAFSGFTYAQSSGSDLILAASGCLGCAPRAVDWNEDELVDLVIGLSGDGSVRLYLNIGTAASPTFDGGTTLTVGAAKEDISVGYRAVPTIVDWNSDGKKDLVVGAYDGRIHLFINEGTNAAPMFLAHTYAQDGGVDLDVATSRSAPTVLDVTNDGRKDLLTGDTNGQLLLYANVGTDQAPTFSGFTQVTADGVPIDLPISPRSRPSACDWTGDGLTDVLIGAGDGLVRLYQGVWVPGDGNTDLLVDGADYTIWADGYLSEPVPPQSQGGWSVGNFNEDAVVNGADYTIWADNYSAPGKAPVPEPAALSLLVLGALGLIRRRGR